MSIDVQGVAGAVLIAAAHLAIVGVVAARIAGYLAVRRRVERAYRLRLAEWAARAARSAG